MTKVNFYKVQGNLDAVLALTCRLVERAWQQDTEVLIYTDEEQTAARMSDALWDWSAGSFLPHRLQAEGPENIQIHAGPADADNVEQIIGQQHGLLVNLAAQTPGWFARFDKLCEFVHGDEALLAGKRHRYRFYKDRGYPLQYHDMSERF